ncbi:unnamed protein product, partial [Staurois parvus]
RGGALLTPICRGGALLTPICQGWSPPDSCRGGALNHGLASPKRPAHTCAISTLAAPKIWAQDWRFHPSQISKKSPGYRSQNRLYQPKRKLINQFPLQ